MSMAWSFNPVKMSILSKLIYRSVYLQSESPKVCLFSWLLVDLDELVRKNKKKEGVALLGNKTVEWQ